MKLIFPALCWAVLIGGFACAKKPKPAPEVDIFDSAEVPVIDPDEKILDLTDEVPAFGPVFFEFDSHALREVYKVAALAEYLKKTGRGLVLTGYASEEGTDEYNLALGARRAQAVRDYLEAAGVRADRIRWASLGEESPLTHDPAKFHLNRRVEIALSEEP